MKLIYLLLIFYTIFSISAKGQNFKFANTFKNKPFDSLYKKDANGNFKQLKKIYSSLKGYIQERSEESDTLMIRFWDIVGNDPKKDSAEFINIDDNEATFAFVPKWNNKRYIKVPFATQTLTATSIPFRYRLKKNADLEAEFLNAGINYFFIKGNTKIYKHPQIEPRNSYVGWGPFIAFSQQKIDSASTGGFFKEEKQVAAISYGLSFIYTINSFSIVLAAGFENAIGTNAKYWEDNNFRGGLKPWIGFGFGIKLTEIEIKPVNKD